MDPALKELCLQMIDGDVDSERFSWLLIETGVQVDGPEWDVASRLLGRREEAKSLQQKFGETLQ